MKDLKPVKAYRVRFSPDSNARYLVYISESCEIPSLYSATIVAMNMDSPTADQAYAHWNRASEISLDDLREHVDDELHDLNPGKTISFEDERWIERA